nr:cysteine-rich CWC family protein [uncultured Pseudogulbenkiania sp.]
MSTSKPIPSPCIQQCRLDDAGQSCRGCRRTLDEIAGWSGFDEMQKQAVWVRLQALPLPVVGKHCQRCGAAFRCGEGGPDGGCWCSALPAVLPLVPSGGDCLCPSCLRDTLRQAYAARGLSAPF